MFEKNVLSSIKKMIDTAKGDRKISDMKGNNYSPKRSRDIKAPSYEEAVNNNNVILMKTFNSTELICPLSQSKEVRTDVTPDLLKKILKSTAKAKSIDSTVELALQGSQDAMKTTVSSNRIKELKSSCPSMKTLALQNLNLCPKQKNRRVRLADFPANIERLSLRNSTLEPKSFFKKMTCSESKLDKLRVLDLGRVLFTADEEVAPEKTWPKLVGLEELYLEGAPRMNSPQFLETILQNFPNLKVLDLEGTELSEDVLITIAKYAPNLRELYLGYTNVTDVSIARLLDSRLGLDRLQIICLSETLITDLGVQSIVRCCQSLHTITVKRSKVSESGVKAARLVIPDVTVNRVENTHIYAVFRNQGCEHFTQKHDVCALNMQCKND